MRRNNPVVTEHLRSLDLHQVGALDGAVNEAGAVHMLVCMADRDGRGGRPMLASGLEPGMDQLVADQRPRAVMDDHKIRRILCEALQSEANRVLPSFTAEANVNRLPPAITFQFARDFEQIALRDQQRDARDLGAAVERLEGSPNQ